MCCKVLWPCVPEPWLECQEFPGLSRLRGLWSFPKVIHKAKDWKTRPQIKISKILVGHGVYAYKVLTQEVEVEGSSQVEASLDYIESSRTTGVTQ